MPVTYDGTKVLTERKVEAFMVLSPKLICQCTGGCIDHTGPCRYDDPAGFEIDHVRGLTPGERLHGRLAQANLYNYIRKHPEQACAEFQLLCWLCHMNKTTKNDIDPWPDSPEEAESNARAAVIFRDGL
jgi:hypothetical protein